VPREILARPKQPYRAPDAESFLGPGAPEWTHDVLGERSVAEAGVFDDRAVAQFHAKCSRQVAAGKHLSNTDNMALVGVLSTQLLHASFVNGHSA
jgi:asparagine synthase (glutamine-hydrolysing)